MKKILSIFLLLASIQLIFAQEQDALPYEPMDTWPYLYERFEPGNVRTTQGTLFPYAALNICIADGTLHYIEKGKIMQADNKMAILGAMRELGEVSAEEHQHVVDYLKTSDIKTVWLVGEEFEDTQCDFRKFKDVEEVKAAIAAEQPTGHYILIKGSNSTKLYQLPELL